MPHMRKGEMYDGLPKERNVTQGKRRRVSGTPVLNGREEMPAHTATLTHGLRSPSTTMAFIDFFFFNF